MNDIDRSLWRSTWRQGRATSEDGTRIAYEVVGQGDRILLLANGLGGRLYAWSPLIDAFWRNHRLITWDYRGLFDSDTPASPRRLAVSNHVEDAVAILRAEGCSRAVLCGWSMGVQVSIDVACTYPDLVAGLVLLNGTYGHTLASGFQPFFALPFVPKRLHYIIEWLRATPAAADTLAILIRNTMLATLSLFAITAGPRSFEMRPMLERYADDVLGPSFENYLRLFQELDAHSTYHLLPDVEAPALIVSGLFDFLTPARQSREMKRRMPDAEHIDLWRASHFVLLERPEIVVPAVAAFLETRAKW